MPRCMLELDVSGECQTRLCANPRNARYNTFAETGVSSGSCNRLAWNHQIRQRSKPHAILPEGVPGPRGLMLSRPRNPAAHGQKGGDPPTQLQRTPPRRVGAHEHCACGTDTPEPAATTRLQSLPPPRKAVPVKSSSTRNTQGYDETPAIARRNINLRCTCSPMYAEKEGGNNGVLLN